METVFFNLIFVSFLILFVENHNESFVISSVFIIFSLLMFCFRFPCPDSRHNTGGRLEELPDTTGIVSLFFFLLSLSLYLMISLQLSPQQTKLIDQKIDLGIS